MAFFSITRYTGEDEDELEKGKGKSILQKLHEEAKKRKSLQSDAQTRAQVETETPTKKQKQDESTVTITHIQEQVSSKKKKVKELSKTDKLKIDVKEDKTPTISPKKKKKSEIDVKEDKTPTKSPKKKKKSEIKVVKSKGEKTKKVKRQTVSDSDEDEVSDQNKTVNLGDSSFMDASSSKIKGSSASTTSSSSSSSSSSSEGDEDENEKSEESAVDDEKDEDAFTVLGQVSTKKLPKVQRVLPNWLAEPTVINDDIRNKRTPLEDVAGLDDDLIQKLRQNGVKDFFPVQGVLLPELLKSFHPSYLHGMCGFRPSDICCSAPTGSGKTLAYVLPVVQALHCRVVPQIRVLVVLPVRDLVKQVHKVFTTYCKDTKLKVGIILGNKSFASEQQTLVKKSCSGYESLCDILVCTPGRLVDHINKTPGFTLQHLRFLIIDEADRMMDEIKQDWLSYVESAVYSTRNHSQHNKDELPGKWGSVAKQQVEIYGDIQREAPTVMTVGNACQPRIVLQKLLFSATLSQNPEKLQQLNLFQPKLYTSIVQGSTVQANTTLDDSMKTQGEFIGKYTTPAGLTEFFVESNTNQKPLVMLRFLEHFQFKHMLCFANSVQTAHRLYWLIKLACNLEVREITSRQLNDRRDRILRQFADGKIDILICSDAMARGIDIEGVKYVVSYDSPTYLKTYIHRVGRTARAGKVGTAITLLEKKEIYHFKKMLKDAGKTGVKEMKFTASELKPFVPSYTSALNELKEILESESRDSKQH